MTGPASGSTAGWRRGGRIAVRPPIWACLGALLLVALSLPTLAARALSNASLLLLTRGVVGAATLQTAATYPPRWTGQRRNLLDRAAHLSAWAGRLGGSDPVVAWTAGRVALARDEPAEAVRVLDRVIGPMAGHAFLPMDYVDACRRVGRLDEAIEVLERQPRDVASPLLHEHAATVYLSKGRALLASGDAGAADSAFRKAADARPADLAALRYLLSREQQQPEGEAEQARDRLTYFALESIDPATEALGALTGEAMLGLYADRQWELDQLLGVLSMLAWRRPDARWVGDTLARLAGKEPERADWHLSLGEWYQRRGEHDLAAREYGRALGRGPADIVAQRRVADGAGAEPPAIPASAPQPARPSDHDILALLLGESPAPFTIGPDLVGDGDFARWNQFGPSGWRWLDQATSEYSARGLYVHGRDDLDPWTGPSVRISRLWNDLRDARSPGAFGLRPSRLELEPGSAYLMTCAYRTRRVPDGAANIYVSDDPMRLIPGGEIRLPATGGSWRLAAAVVPNTTDQQVGIIPLLRLTGSGDIWFDDFALRKLGLPDGLTPRRVVSRVFP